MARPPDEPPPPGFNWDAWLGPAPMRAYNKNRTFYRFRWFYDYSGGQVTNFGVHYMDAIQWALGHDAPLAVTAMGGKLVIEDNREIPDTLEVLWTYPGGTLVTFSQYNATAAPAAKDRRVEIEFRGTKGTLYLYSDGYEIVPDDITPNEFPARTPVDRQLERGYRVGRETADRGAVAHRRRRRHGHTTRATSSTASRAARPATATSRPGHRSTSATLIANVAHKTKSYLEWDREAERFTNNEKANALLSYRYRAPYKAPRT